MPKSVLRFIWDENRPGHLKLLALVVVLVAFNYASLELPRLIVNAVTDALGAAGAADRHLLAYDITLPERFGGGVLWHSEGFQVEPLGLLAGLCAVLLLLLLAQQQISARIDVYRLRVGEALARTLRGRIYDLILRLRPEAPMKSRAIELSRLLRGEISGIGRFARSAFVQCFLSIGLISSSVLLIFMQTALLGFATLAILGLNGLLLVWLRRDNAARTAHYQAVGRGFARYVSNALDRLPMMHALSTSAVERHGMAARLDDLYEATVNLKRKTPAETVMSSLLSDIPTLVFYFAGGWLALSGRLDIGQLVAIIAAYQQIPDPLKALVGWDEERLEAQLQYDFLVQQTGSAACWPPDHESRTEPDAASFDGSVRVRDLSVMDGVGRRLLDHVSVDLSGGQAVALIGGEASGKHAFAQVLGRLVTHYQGVVRVGGHDLDSAPAALYGRRIAYVGTDTVLVLDATVRDNLAVGLQGGPRVEDGAQSAEPASGAEFDAHMLASLSLAGLDESILRLGLERRLDPAAHPSFCAQIVALRARVGEAVAQRETRGGRAGSLVEPLDEDRFIRWMTLGENILFGAPLDGGFDFVTLAAHPEIAAALAAEGLADGLVATGRTIALALMEIAEASGSIELVDTKGLVGRGGFSDLVRILTQQPEGESAAERAFLTDIAARYCEPVHRLGLIDAELERQVLAVRLRLGMVSNLDGVVARYQAHHFCPALSVRDNLLFGRIAAETASARTVIDRLIRDILGQNGLDTEIENLALDLRLGDGGFPLVPSERARLALARALLPRPDLLVIDDVLRPLSIVERRAIVADIVAARAGRTTIVVAEPSDPHDIFKARVWFEHGRVARIEAAGRSSSTRPMEATA